MAKEIMTEAQIEDVSEVVTPEAEAEAQVEASSEPEAGSKEFNLRNMRLIIEEQQRLIENLKAQSAPVVADEDDFEEELPPDSDYLDVATFKKLREADQRKMEKKLQAEKRRMFAQNVKSNYPDIKQVVTRENVEELIRGDALLEQTLNEKYDRDPLEAEVFAYSLIKKSNFYNKKKAPVQKTYEKAKENLAKPISSAALGQPSPVQAAKTFAELTQEERRALEKEMHLYAQRR